MKRRIFLVCLFYCFFRLPIYESIAAIFWQSASYVKIRATYFSEESPRSPRKPLTNLNNFGDSLQVNNALSNEATKSQLFDDNEKNLGASHVSDLYEDDFGSSANSINLPKSSARSGKGVGGISGLIEKSEISEDLEDQEDEVEEELSEPLEEEEPTNDKNAKVSLN